MGRIVGKKVGAEGDGVIDGSKVAMLPSLFRVGGPDPDPDYGLINGSARDEG